MSEPKLDGRSDLPGGPAKFPPGECLFEDRPFDAKLFAEVDRLVESGECSEGRLEVEVGEVRLTALIHNSAPWLAGSLDGSKYRRLSLYDFVLEAQSLEDARATFTRTDGVQMVIAALHFCEKPELNASTRRVDPLHLLDALSEENKDAAVAIERGGTRTLLFVHRGRPVRLYFGEPELDSGSGGIVDQWLDLAFASGVPEGHLEVFALEKIQADRDAGTGFEALAASARSAPPTIVTIGLPGGRTVARRVFVPPEMVVGRERTCELRVDNLAVSRKHCRLVWSKGRFFVEDLGSANGTWVNDEQVNRSEVGEDDSIRAGKFLVRLTHHIDLHDTDQTLLVGTRGAGALARLEGEGVSVSLGKDVILGQGNGVDAPARGLFVRSVHARISPRGVGLYRLTCFGSCTVRLNGKRVRTSRLQIGDVLEVGRSRFEIAADSDHEQR